MKTIMKLGLGILVLGLVSCQLVDFEEAALKTTDDTPLVDTEWDLVSFEEMGDGESEAGSVGILLILEEGGQVKGESYQNAGGPPAANKFFGIYELKADSQLEIDSLRSTFVNEPTGSRYEQFLAALENAAGYELDEDDLRIQSETGNILIFKARE